MKYLLFICLTLCTVLCAQGTITDQTTQQSFPTEVSFDADGKHYDLQVTGVATRKKLVFKIYSVAHYLQKGISVPNKDKIDAIFSDDNAKQLTLKWVRDVGADKIQDTFQESFERVFPGKEYAKNKSSIDTFMGFFSKSAHDGDEFIFRWIPGGTIEVLINGKVIGSVSNKDFAKGLWSIWLGKDSIVNRGDLLRGA